jgi:precorrin-3B C17-methyltransferase
VEIVPGVTAALSGSAVLGAPLSHDFCIISLSDLLTPWEVIEKRLLKAAEGDFCMAIYNPSSKKRADYLKKACEILLTVLSPDTSCGYVRNIGRDGQEKKVCNLSQLAGENVDMFVTVFIGNSKTKITDGMMITPRGYDI